MLKLFMMSLSLIAMQFPAYADWREDLGTLRIGILAGADVSRSIAFAEPFRLAVQEHLNINVEIYGARDYAGLVQAHTSGRVEYAVFSATAYAASHKICECNEPLVVAKSGDGKHNFQSVLIAREGGIKSTSDLNGKQIIALSKDSIGGYAFALHELTKAGIAIPSSDIRFGSTPANSVLEFSAGSGHALIGWSSLSGDEASGYSRGSLKDLIPESGNVNYKYNVIWKSSPIPHRVHSIVKKFPQEAKQALKSLLLDLYEKDPIAYDAIEPIFGGGFAQISQRDFLPLIDFVANPLSSNNN